MIRETRQLQRQAWAGLIGLMVGMIGCGGPRTDYSKVDLGEVQGTIQLDGEPLAEAVVIFESPDQTYSYAQTDEHGNYRLMFNSEKSGVTTGTKTVRIRTSGGLGEEAEASLEEEEDGGEAGTAAPELVPACYNSNSQLQATVAGGSQTLDFELNSDCSTTGPAS